MASIAFAATTTNTTSEGILWDRFRAGDEEAFATIYDRFAAELFKYGLHLCGSEELVKDCIHDLFVYIYAKRKNLGKTSSIKFYLFRCIKREIAKASLKSKRTITKEDMASIPAYNFEVAISPETILLAKESSRQATRQLQLAINDLPRSQREIVYLVYYAGFNYDQVAEVLQISMRTVYNQVYNAIQKLKLTLVPPAN
jgi:RNA polymerase sigma factor (sigma-70 family)